MDPLDGAIQQRTVPSSTYWHAVLKAVCCVCVSLLLSACRTRTRACGACAATAALSLDPLQSWARGWMAESQETWQFYFHCTVIGELSEKAIFPFCCKDGAINSAVTLCTHKVAINCSYTCQWTGSCTLTC
eukprot:4283713-Amphidinium_carterae.1